MINSSPLTSIVMVVADLHSGGTQRVVTSLANYWAENDRKVVVVTMSSPKTDFFPLSSNVQRIVIGGQANSSSTIGGLMSNIRRVYGLRKVLKELDANAAIGLICQTNIILTLSALGLKTKIIISERNDPKRQSLGRLWDLLRRYVYPMADLVTANSHEVVLALKEIIHESRLAYLPNPVTTCSTEKASDPGNNKVIAVGRLHQQKAHDILIGAFSIVCRKHPDWQLEILGEGSQRQSLEDQITRLGLLQHVKLLGRVKNVDMYLAKASIFVLPSRFEGTPNALLEALSSGVPAIVSNTSVGALEYIEHKVNGLVVPVDDPEALAQAICQMIEDKTLRKEFAAKSISSVQHISLPRVAEIWESVVTQTINH
jgi:GalNAc-alpha-(1->4)-GalNAc-alpha-(1->3)-diNAcBac-PP-undecaprenol alpha-1,4-N-acetyl-D-galactosaminyltransferase